MQYTPVIAACVHNSTETLKVLLKHGANPNVFYDPNKIKKTTMHFAANYTNIEMMKLLIDHGFDCDRLINSIYYGEHHASVFLILCSLGNVKCMDYLMSCCKHKINVKQKTIKSMNGLQAAIHYEQLKMVEYLLTKVYDNDELRMEIMDQRVGIPNQHTFELAACNSTRDGLDIFKLLRKYKCPMNNVKQIFRYASMFSPLIFEYMLNEKLYPSLEYLGNGLIGHIVSKTQGIMIYQNIEIVVKYLQSMLVNCALYVKKYYIANAFFQIMQMGTFHGYFKFIKHLIAILLHTDDWKHFIKSHLIDKQVLQQIFGKISDPNNTVRIKDKIKWCKLLDTMCKSIEEANTNWLAEYDYQDDTKNNDDYIWNGCGDTVGTVSELNTLLKKKQFKQFSLKIKSYNSTSKILKQVERLNLHTFLHYFVINCFSFII